MACEYVGTWMLWVLGLAIFVLLLPFMYVTYLNIRYTIIKKKKEE
jgi:uncharacterized membrane protein